jgi:hypothetical protein
MDPVTGSLIAGSIAAPIVGGYFGNKAASKEAKAQRQLMIDIQNQINAIPIPEERMMKLEELKSQGIISPEMEQTFMLQDSELNKYAADPRMKEAQLGALTGLQQEAQAGGLNISDRAKLNRALQESTAAEAGMRGAALQQLSRRGMGGSGMNVAQALQSASMGANQANQAGLDVAAGAQDRALRSLIAAGEMGGNIRGQDYAEAAKRAEAQDMINRFNLANRQQVQSANVGARNLAQASNLQSAQDIANQNVGTRNQAYQYNLQAPQRTYQNQIAKFGLASGAASDMANMYGQQAAATKQMWGGIGQGVGQGLGSFAQYYKPSDTSSLAASSPSGSQYNLYNTQGAYGKAPSLK